MDFFSSDLFVQPKRGDLLISEPYLPDHNFERTVILVCEHDEKNGSIGFILNKPISSRLCDLLKNQNLKNRVFNGGPVLRNSLHFIHRDHGQRHQSKEIIDGVYWAGDFDDMIFRLESGLCKPSHVKFFIGYAGWSPNQLVEELKQKSWIVCNELDMSMIFEVSPEVMWSEVLKRMGGKFKMIADYPLDPRLN